MNEERIKRKLKAARERRSGVKLKIRDPIRFRNATEFAFDIIPRGEPKRAATGMLTYAKRTKEQKSFIPHVLVDEIYPKRNLARTKLTHQEVREATNKLFKVFPRAEWVEGMRATGLRSKPGRLSYRQVIRNPKFRAAGKIAMKLLRRGK